MTVATFALRIFGTPRLYMTSKIRPKELRVRSVRNDNYLKLNGNLTVRRPGLNHHVGQRSTGFDVNERAQSYRCAFGGC